MSCTKLHIALYWYIWLCVLVLFHNQHLEVLVFHNTPSVHYYRLVQCFFFFSEKYCSSFKMETIPDQITNGNSAIQQWLPKWCKSCVIHRNRIIFRVLCTLNKKVVENKDFLWFVIIQECWLCSQIHFIVFPFFYIFGLVQFRSVSHFMCVYQFTNKSMHKSNERKRGTHKKKTYLHRCTHTEFAV